MEERVRQILTELETLRENLLALSDDIWLNIEHNDQQAMEEGVRFKHEYNEKMYSFDNLATDISVMIQQFLDIKDEEEAETASGNQDENERLIRSLNIDEPHNLFENFCYKRPYGFIVQQKAFKNTVTWRKLYRNLCQYLYELNPTLFASLLDNPDFISNRGNKSFSIDENELNAALKIVDGIYAEVNLSANSICKNIIKLLDVFNIPSDQFKIFLREDRNA